MTRLHVATLNIRNLADRWTERLPLLLADFASLQPDLLGLQEVVFPMEQDRIIGSAGPSPYQLVRAWAGRPEYGNSILVREPLAPSDPARLELGQNRSAGRVRVAIAGTSLTFVNLHLHHEVPDDAIRAEQVRLLLDWLAGDAGASGGSRPGQPVVEIVVGDFNADPAEPAYARMVDAGFRSALLEANGAEPAVTWPSGLEGPAIDTDGEPSCLDYIWLRGSVGVESARVVFDRPAAEDPGLLPSDHFGLSAHLRLDPGP
jgi:endonuclease/exonuclease/phosphatase family metal-dependent hydrolase